MKSSEERLGHLSAYQDWSQLIQCITGVEHPTQQGRGAELRTTTVHWVPVPEGVPGMPARVATVGIVGEEAIGYKVKARGRFPSPHQVTFLLQRAVDYDQSDYWIGHDDPEASLLIHAKPLLDPNGDDHYITPPESVESPCSPYSGNRLSTPESAAFAGLLFNAAHQALVWHRNRVAPVDFQLDTPR